MCFPATGVFENNDATAHYVAKKEGVVCAPMRLVFLDGLRVVQRNVANEALAFFRRRRPLCDKRSFGFSCVFHRSIVPIDLLTRLSV